MAEHLGINRRAFLKSTAGLVALATLDLGLPGCTSSGTREKQSALRPPMSGDEQLNVAVIGLGMRGPTHIGNLGAKNNCRILYVCDADTARAQAGLDKARTSNDGVEAKFEQDIRCVLDDKDVHIVSIATCNHWHSLAAIWAMQAGKDVYVEKPLSHNLSEGRRVVQVAENTRRVCQHGSQMRSSQAIIEAVKFVRDGKLGKIDVSRALCYKPRGSIGQVNEPQPPPSTVDYNLWCGPAPLAPVNRAKFHYDWHWFWDTGNGDIGNQGIHEIDLARWFLGTDDMPKSVFSLGGRFGYVDDGQTPNTQIAEYDFGSGKPRVVVEVRGLKTAAYKTNGVENVVECEHGYVVSPSYNKAIAYDRDGNVIQKFETSDEGAHFKNFLEVVRNGRISDLNCPAIEGHRSCSMLHMANISYRLGMESPIGGGRPDEAVRRMWEHLSDDGVDLSRTTYMRGKPLQYDAKSETFVNDKQANRMLTREYRAPFVVPERV